MHFNIYSRKHSITILSLFLSIWLDISSDYQHGSPFLIEMVCFTSPFISYYQWINIIEPHCIACLDQKHLKNSNVKVDKKHDGKSQKSV